MSAHRVQNATSTGDLHYHDVIDLRDLVELRDELRGREACDNCGEHAHENVEGTVVHSDTLVAECENESADDTDTTAELSDMLDADEVALLAELDRFDRDELNGNLDTAANNEPTLIADSYFEDYAKQWADEVGYVSDSENARNPLLNFIDWPAWAEHLKTDFHDVELAGATFLYRD
jgi:hypothetical protein